MQKLYSTFCKLEEILCAAGLIAIIALIFISIIFSLLKLSIAWNIDIALFLLSWITFLGIDIIWRKSCFISEDILTNHQLCAVKKFVRLAAYIFILCVLVIIVAYGCRAAWNERFRMYQSTSIPYSFMIMSFVTAALSMSLTTVLKIKRCILSFKNSPHRDTRLYFPSIH